MLKNIKICKIEFIDKFVIIKLKYKINTACLYNFLISKNSYS